MHNKSVMVHNFTSIPSIRLPHSVFNRSHGHKFTMRAGTLVPFYVDEVLPQDTFKGEANFVIRFNDLLRPFLDNVFFDTFYFYVPNRLVWEHWERFCGAKRKPSDSTDFVVPKLAVSRVFFQDPESIYSYMLGIGYYQIPNDLSVIYVNALPFRMYNLIWNEWFKSSEICDDVSVVEEDNGDPIYVLLRRMKRPDYFTNCLPLPLQGPEVRLPIGGSAPVSVFGSGNPLLLTSGALASYGPAGTVAIGPLSSAANTYSGDVNASQLFAPGFPSTLVANFDGTPYHRDYSNFSVPGGTPPLSWHSSVGGLSALTGQLGVPTQAQFNAYNDAVRSEILEGEKNFLIDTGLIGTADLSRAFGVTINQLRNLIAVQHLYERDARSGLRYTEILQAHFGVVNQDLRLFRPEFLGCSSHRLSVTQVPQTSFATEYSPQGNLAAFSLSGAHSAFKRSFEEHGFVIGLCCIRADLTYQQGLDRMWSRSTRFDYYWPEFANLGEQAVLSKEIYCTGEQADENVFGYQEYAAEYRYKSSKISGYLNSKSYGGSLDVWTLSQNFTSRPVLNQSFMEENPPIDRVRALSGNAPFLIDMYMNLKCARPLPVYSVPGLKRL